PGRLARHRHQRKPLRPRLPDRPVQRLTQPERLHPHRLTRQHPHIMINHRDRLLVLRQVNPDHRAITRQHRPQPLPPRVPPTIPPGHAATLAHRDVLSGCAWDTKPALSHQEDVPASTASPTTGASSALSYYYACDTTSPKPGTEVSRPASRCQRAALPVIRPSRPSTASSNTAIRSRCRRH